MDESKSVRKVMPGGKSVVTSTPLALRPRDAAEALSISERKLWDLTAPRGSIRCARLGTAVVYPVEELKRWLAEQAGRGI